MIDYEKKSIHERLISNVFKLGGLVAAGTLGFVLIEGWEPLDALFMTVMTITTVGFGEPHPLDDNGKIFTILLMLAGIGFVLYILSDIVELLIEANRGRLMKHKIVKLTDHRIVCGYGRTGQEVSEQFLINKIPFVVVEQDPERARQAELRGILVLIGDASDDDILIEAQLSSAKGIVCALPDDRQNAFIAITAKGLNEKIDVVSRAANPGSEAKLKRAGVRMVISPYVICGKRLAASITHPLVTEFLDVVMHAPEHDLRMEQVAIKERSTLVGRTLKDANIRQTSGVMILAVNQNGKLITNPSPDLTFGIGDELIGLGAQQDFDKLGQLASRT
jgi:voltage-gated potassium channel